MPYKYCGYKLSDEECLESLIHEFDYHYKYHKFVIYKGLRLTQNEMENMGVDDIPFLIIMVKALLNEDAYDKITD